MSQEMNIEKYEGLVNFLGVVLGAQYEILLQDIKKKVILSVANGYISVRVKGGSLTNFAEKIVAEQMWKHEDYLSNIKCYTPSGHLILCYFYFIKTEQELLGLLCINFDTTKYSSNDMYVGDLRAMMSSLSDSKEANIRAGVSVNDVSCKRNGGDSGSAALSVNDGFSSITTNVETIIDNIVREYLTKNNVSVERLRYEEKIAIIEELSEKEVFQVKGSISYAARALSCSETTIYRYLKEIKKKT